MGTPRTVDVSVIRMRSERRDLSTDRDNIGDVVETAPEVGMGRDEVDLVVDDEVEELTEVQIRGPGCEGGLCRVFGGHHDDR